MAGFPEQLRVLTYNVHGWITPEGRSNVDAVAAIVSATGADFVGLNEVFHPVEGGATPLTRLARTLNYSLAFGATQSTDPTRHPPYGNAFLSRWPIQAHAAHHLSPLTAYGKRGLLEVRALLPDGSSFTAYVTHLDHRSETLRLEQWAAAHTWLVRDRERPHLLLGDFNALSARDYPTPESLHRLAEFQAEQGWPVAAFDLTTQVAKSGYVDLQAHSLPAPTFPAAGPERRIDYIFAPAVMASALRSCKPVVDELTAMASDHLPVLAEFLFTAAARHGDGRRQP